MTAMNNIGRVISLADRRGPGDAASRRREDLPAGTFAFVPTSIVMDRELGKSAVRVGMFMAARAHRDTKECWLSTDTMAAMLGLPRSSIIKGLRQLVDRGHALRRRRTEPGRGQTSSSYMLLFRPPDVPVFGPEEDAQCGGGDNTGEGVVCAGELPCQSVSLDRTTRSPGHGEGAPSCGEVPAGDRFPRSPATLPGDRFSEAGDRNPQGPVTAPRGHDQDTNRILRSGSDARAGESTTASVDNVRVAVPTSGPADHRAKWAARLDQYRPWEPGKSTWPSRWGLPPDSAGVNPTMPKDLRAKWRADAAAARAEGMRTGKRG